MTGTIDRIIAREIIDSRGHPTIEVDVSLINGFFGRASVPSGASTGSHEAIELRDSNSKRYLGKGVRTAVNNINEKIGPLLKGYDPLDQKKIDDMLIQLDGTPNKSNLGGNAMLGVSLATARAASDLKNQSLFKYLGSVKEYKLPVPLMNIINGGSHADNAIDFQEFMIMPIGAKTFSKAIQMSCEVFQTLKSNLNTDGFSTNIGDEGGFAPKLSGTEDALETIIHSIEKSGYRSGNDVMIALDCASSEFFNKGIYDYSIFEGSNGKKLNSNEQADYLSQLSKNYPIISIEDGMDENDWHGWSYLTKVCGKRVQLVGDDLFVTNSDRLKKGIKEKVGNSILIKVNQIGTLTETIDAVKIAKDAGYTTVMSHRSGETEDSTIADLAVALSTGQIKTGSASRSDRMAKYNQLIRIEEALGSDAIYPQKDAFNIIF